MSKNKHTTGKLFLDSIAVTSRQGGEGEGGRTM